MGFTSKTLTNGAQASLVLKVVSIENKNAEAFEIKSSKNQIVISANTSKGVLYGVFELIRRMQTSESLENLKIASAPKIQFTPNKMPQAVATPLPPLKP